MQIAVETGGHLGPLEVSAICNINAHQNFEFSVGNHEIMQKLPLKSVIFTQKVPFILHIAVSAQPSPFASDVWTLLPA